jgi:hypothetical protein
LIDPAIKNGDVSQFTNCMLNRGYMEKKHGNYNAGWWFGPFFIFPSYIGIILPIDFHIFQQPTRISYSKLLLQRQKKMAPPLALGARPILDRPIVGSENEGFCGKSSNFMS